MSVRTTICIRESIASRCGACRYFTHERCCHSTARLNGDDRHDGDCPSFRFIDHGWSTSPGYGTAVEY
jgi:hypothetical protein